MNDDARARVLACLIAAGEEGITTWEIIHAAHHSRAVGRIWEIRKAHEVEKVVETGRVYRWIYRGVKPIPSLLEQMSDGVTPDAEPEGMDDGTQNPEAGVAPVELVQGEGLPWRHRWLSKQYDMVIVDEAQDMTVAQLEIATGVVDETGDVESSKRNTHQRTLTERRRDVKYRINRTDTGSKELIAYAKSLGFDYEPMGGSIDGILAWGQTSICVDWKSKGGTLTPSQQRMVARGFPLRFLSTTAQIDALRAELMKGAA